jgi:hypothetical protein
MTMNTTARWKLVPVEPTPEMVREARHSIDCPASGSDHPADIYRAMLSAAPAPAAPQDERASLNDLLLDVGALLSPLVEAGHAIAIGEARRVLKRVRTARAALPAQAVAPARYTDADMLKAHAQGFKHGARHAQLAVATVGDEPVMEIMADMEMNSTGGMHVVRMLKPVPAGSLLYTRPAPAQAATAGGHEIWACWVDGADPDKTWPMFVGYEPMAYPQRKRVAFVSAPAQDVAPTDARCGCSRFEQQHCRGKASPYAEHPECVHAAQPAAQPADALEVLWWAAGALAASPMAQDDTICIDGVTRSVSAILDAASAVLAARTQENAS